MKLMTATAQPLGGSTPDMPKMEPVFADYVQTAATRLGDVLWKLDTTPEQPTPDIAGALKDARSAYKLLDKSLDQYADSFALGFAANARLQAKDGLAALTAFSNQEPGSSLQYVVSLFTAASNQAWEALNASQAAQGDFPLPLS